MELRKYFDETANIENELTEARKKYEELIDKYHTVRKLCTHDIVFKFVDNQPRLAPVEGNYFCPACNLVIQFAEKGQIENSKYKNSRIISLPNLSLRNGKNLHKAIRQEVYENLELYYSKKIDEDFLSKKMEEVLITQQIDYSEKNKVLKK